MEHEDEDEKFLAKLQAADLKNLTEAANNLIDPISKFMSTKELEELEPQDFVDALNALDYATFIISGIMYSYGMNSSCDHDHDEEEDVD